MMAKRPDFKRQLWMTKFERLYLDAYGNPGKVDWDTAAYLYNVGHSPDQAVDLYFGSKEEKG